MTDADALLRRRVLDHLSWTVHALSDEVHRYGPAWGVRTPSLPQVWTLNQLHVSEPMAVDEVMALAGRHQQDLPFLHVEVGDEATARALEDRVRAEGWTVDCEVLMVLGHPSSAPAPVSASAPLSALDDGSVASEDDDGIVDFDEDEAMEVMRRWLWEEYPAMSDPVRAQLEVYTRGEGRLWGERVLGVRGGDGDPVAMTKLRVSGGTVWVEDVYTVPEERRRGHARRLVSRAASLAATATAVATASAVTTVATGDAIAEAPGIAFIVADDNDWPKHLYAEVGFHPVGRMWTFHREKGGSAT